MRGPKFDAMSGLWMAAFLGASLVAVPSVGAAKAQDSPVRNSAPDGTPIQGGRAGGSPRVQQSGSQTVPKLPGMPPIDGERPNEGNDPMAAQQRASRARALADDRQKHIVDETAKLLQLATELKASVDKSNKNELPVDLMRKADEIEKLAHDVKQRMRG